MRRIIIDTDMGIDDLMAIAFMLYFPEVNIEAITTVYGVVEVGLSSKNALKILEALGKKDIPVYQGVGKPLVRSSFKNGRFVHGDNGLGNVSLLEPTQTVMSKHAVDFIIDEVMKKPNKIEILALGPITNIALALSLKPEIAKKIKKIVFMGGAFLSPGNVSPMASSNVFKDPESLKVVLDSGVSFTFVGLDVTKKVIFTAQDLNTLKKTGKAGKLVSDVCQFRIGLAATEVIEGDRKGFISSDAVTAIYTINQDLFRTKSLAVDVEIKGEYTYGKTVGDFNNQYGKEPNAIVCMGVNAKRAADFYIQQFVKNAL